MYRRLSAILTADMVGYSRLMAADEAATIARQKELLSEIFEPAIARFRGRVVKTMGDGVLVEFSSAVDAVQSALQIQRSMVERHAEMTGEEGILYRIGINLGDIAIDGDDVLGDGVNVAARLEGLAEPGGICISDIVYQTLQGKLAEPFSDAGEQALKNMTRKVRVWQWAPGLAGVGPRSAALSSSKPSIAVLPFTNLSGDADQDYFSDGITEDIMTELSRFGSLKVIARRSSFVLRDREKDLRQTVASFGADYLLEGSVRRDGKRIRLTAQLVDARSESQIWAHRYDRELADVFAIQDDLVQAIVTQLADRLTAAEASRSMRKTTDSLDAYDCFLRALNLDRRYTKEDSLEAKRLLDSAIKMDPNFARAHALLSAQLWTVPSFDAGLSEEDIKAAVKAGQRAVELDPGDSSCHAMLAVAYLQARNYEQSGRHFKLAFSLNPHDSSIWSDYAWYLAAVGRFDEAAELLSRREQVEPVPPDWHWDVWGHVHIGLGQWREAIACYERTSMLPVNVMAFLSACYGHLGDERKAKEYWAGFVEKSPSARPEVIKRIAYCDQEARADRWLEGLKKAGIE
jgi:TolB-like protein